MQTTVGEAVANAAPIGPLAARAVDFLWTSNTIPGQVIVVVIVAVSVVAAWQARRHRRRYSGFEASCLSRVAAKLKDLQPAAAAKPTEGRPQTVTETVKLEALSDGVPGESLIGDRLAALARLKQARVRTNIDALQQMTRLREQAKLTLFLPGYVANVAMMLGLLGTFIGLAMMVAQLQETASILARGNETDWVTSLSGLSSVIAGKKTAFSCTIVGLICSIGLSWLNFRLARGQSKFYDTLERFTVESLLPAVMPSADGETPFEKISLQLGDSFERLQELTREHSQNVERISAMEKAFAVILDNVVAITRKGDAGGDHQDQAALTRILAQLTTVNGSIVKLVEGMPQMVHAVRDSQQSLAVEIARVLPASVKRAPPTNAWDTLAPAGAQVLVSVIVCVTVLWIVTRWWGGPF